MSSKTAHVIVNIVFMAALVMFGATAVDAANPMMQMVAKQDTAPPAEGAGDEAALPENLSGVNVDEIMSQMTDEQVRRLLIEKLKEEALRYQS